MKKIFCFGAAAALFFAAGCSKNDEPAPQPPVEEEEVMDLSVAGTANCYLVQAPGDYSFDATVMGNGVSTLLAPASGLAPKSAAILWQDLPDLISNVELQEGRIRFTVGEPLQEGNVILAAYDAAGSVLWSWHIWLTGYDPSAGAPKLNGLSWMTRNLGALSDDYDASGSAKGFVYQWGRKDPFPSGSGWIDRAPITVYDGDGKEAPSLFRTEEVAKTSNLAEAIAHPTTYYSGTRDDGQFGPYDWLTTDASAMNDRLWETTDNSGKTLFDPCPPGWRVPRADSWKGVGEGNFIWDEAAYGRRHALLGYYPAVGSRGSATGEWSFVGNSGQYWSSSAFEDYYVNVFYFLPAYVDPLGSANRSTGLPVRCVSETQGDPGPVVPVEDFVLDRVTEASYIGMSGDFGASNYYLGLSDVPFELSESGEQIPLEPGMIMYLDLYGDPSPDPDAAVLPQGTYTVGASKEPGAANNAYTWARVLTDDRQITYRRVQNGKVKVSQTGKGYKIEATFTDTDGKDFAVLYEGALDFINRTQGPSTPTIEQPVHATFTQATATWEYVSDVSDRFTIRLLDGRLEGSELAEGYLLTIDLLSNPISAKGAIAIEPGTYRIGNDYVSPMTFTEGSVFSLMGIPFYYGTYCQEAVAGSGEIRYGFAAEGTIEVQRTEDRYQFDVSLTTPEGIAIEGVYAMDAITFIDHTIEKPAGDWLSILREDKTVIFNPDDASECRVWTYESDIEGLVEYEILVDNNTTDEAFQLLLLAPEGTSSFAGVYTQAADPENPRSGEFIPGYKQLSMLKGTWGYLYYNFNISNYLGAPATEGTIEITEQEDGTIEIQFELKDDAEPKNTVRSVWSGSIRWID